MTVLRSRKGIIKKLYEVVGGNILLDQELPFETMVDPKVGERFSCFGEHAELVMLSGTVQSFYQKDSDNDKLILSEKFVNFKADKEYEIIIATKRSIYGITLNEQG